MEKFESISSAVKFLFGQNAFIFRRDRIHGGDINNAWRVEVKTADSVETEIIFVKTNLIENEAFFDCEVLALECIKKTGAISVPEVLAWGTDSGEAGAADTLFSIRPFCFLILPYIAPGVKNKTYWEDFGHSLASMHRFSSGEFCSKNYGFLQNNFIGYTRQINTPCDSWIEFFRTCRLEPQLKMGWNYLDEELQKKADRLINNLEKYIPEPQFPSLLHGDLWSGNAYTGPEGNVWILDPASYVGHYETDLAMTNLFGGFPARFYNAYDEVNRIDPDFIKRADLYNLYHLLNHLNMFGPGYLEDVGRILRGY